MLASSNMNNMPENAIRLATYAELQEFATAFAESKFNFLVLLGAAGIGKSETVFAAVRDRAHIINTRVCEHSGSS